MFNLQKTIIKCVNKLKVKHEILLVYQSRNQMNLSQNDIDASEERRKQAVDNFRKAREFKEEHSALSLDETFVKRFRDMMSQLKPLNKAYDTDWTLPSIAKMLGDKKRETEIRSQKYDPQRFAKYGYDIGVAHYVVYRRGSIKFVNSDTWLKWTNEKKYLQVEGLPLVFDETCYIECVDLSNINIYYEGLTNLRVLKKLKWLSLENCSEIDDWCLDYISNFSSLEYLNIKNCAISSRGISTLYKLDKLKTLLLKSDGHKYNGTNNDIKGKANSNRNEDEIKLACLNLLEYNLNLAIDIDPSN